jgi:hypothetical protein
MLCVGGGKQLLLAWQHTNRAMPSHNLPHALFITVAAQACLVGAEVPLKPVLLLCGLGYLWRCVRVHAGVKKSYLQRRLRERRHASGEGVIGPAAGANCAGWTLLVTGHSLGGFSSS